MDWPGLFRCDPAGHVEARSGLFWSGADWRGEVRRGLAGAVRLARPDWARRGSHHRAWFGKAGAARWGGASACLARRGSAGSGGARYGEACFGEARHGGPGGARHPRRGAALLGALIPVWCGPDRRGMAWQCSAGEARFGAAREDWRGLFGQGLAGAAWFVPGGAGCIPAWQGGQAPAWSGEAGRGVARSDVARHDRLRTI
jgi:hypothetical protein